eukprot:8501864-Lingulodinium_polyedra.AAC.1
MGWYNLPVRLLTICAHHEQNVVFRKPALGNRHLGGIPRATRSQTPRTTHAHTATRTTHSQPCSHVRPHPH